MPISNFLRAIRNLGRATDQILTPGLHSPEQTRKILDRERERAERSGCPVSVAIFRASSAANGSQPFEYLVKLLQGRMRKTDEIGWFDQAELCVVMPNTKREGARKV